MLQYLTNLFKSKELICLYNDRNNLAKFRFGKILLIDENSIIFYEISRDGKFDGLTLFPVEDVYRVEKDGQYNKRMDILMKPNTFPIFDLEIHNEDIKHAFLSYIAESKKITSITLKQEETVSGLIEKVNDFTFEIHQIDYYGNDDGYATISINSINSIAFQSLDEIMLEYLWKNK